MFKPFQKHRMDGTSRRGRVSLPICEEGGGAALLQPVRCGALTGHRLA